MSLPIWLSPILFVACVAAIYFLSPQSSRAAVQVRVRRGVNALLASAIVLTFTANIAMIWWRTPSLRWLAWAAFVGALLVLARIASSDPKPPSDENQGPL